jgi:hypothetical protein
LKQAANFYTCHCPDNCQPNIESPLQLKNNFFDCNFQTNKPEESFIYPNPNHGNYDVIIESIKTEEGLLEVYDVKGKLVFSERINLIPGKNTIPVSTNKIPSGIYFVRTKTSEGIHISKMFIE